MLKKVWQKFGSPCLNRLPPNTTSGKAISFQNFLKPAITKAFYWIAGFKKRSIQVKFFALDENVAISLKYILTKFELFTSCRLIKR